MFELSQSNIDTPLLSCRLDSEQAGALVTFEGRVRNSNEGKPVLRLEYEAYELLARKEGELIMQEALQKFAVIAVQCVHRTGLLHIGEVAVWVGVLSAHRGDAFDACRYIIDNIKGRVPIWKREYYVDGSVEWVNCAECAKHSPDHANRTESKSVEKNATGHKIPESNTEQNAQGVRS